MFQATASEVLVLKTFLRFSKSDFKYIEESEIFGILRSAQNDGNCAQDDEVGLRTFKNALSGCVAKGFVQKLEKDGKTFYKITEDGFKQI